MPLATSLMHGEQIIIDGERLTVGPAGWNYTADAVEMQFLTEDRAVKIVPLSQTETYEVVSKVTEAEAQPKGRD